MGRAPCCDKANVKKGPWSPEEDAKLKSYIEQHGTGGNWIALPQKIGLKRCGKSCRLRWLNYLRPNIKHGGFSEEEDRIILSLYISIGSRWSIIAAQLPGRTDNDIKNYWNTRLKKKLFGKQRKISGAQKQDPNKKDPENHQTLIMPPGDITSTGTYWHEPASLPNLHIEHQNEPNMDPIKRLLFKLGGGTNYTPADNTVNPCIMQLNSQIFEESNYSGLINSAQVEMASSLGEFEDGFSFNQIKLEGLDGLIGNNGSNNIGMEATNEFMRWGCDQMSNNSALNLNPISMGINQSFDHEQFINLSGM